MTSPVFSDSDIGMLKAATIINDSFLSFELVKEPTWELFEQAGEMDNAGLIDLNCEYFGDRATELLTFNPWNFSGLRVQAGIHVESALAKNDHLAHRTDVRIWTR